jgi:hypothetical protein
MNYRVSSLRTLTKSSRQTRPCRTWTRQSSKRSWRTRLGRLWISSRSLLRLASRSAAHLSRSSRSTQINISARTCPKNLLRRSIWTSRLSTFNYWHRPTRTVSWVNTLASSYWKEKMITMIS